MISLKFDVYIQETNDGFNIYRLVPRKKRLSISVSKEKKEPVSSLLNILITGAKNEDIQEIVESYHLQPELKFLIAKGLISTFLGTEILANDPFRRQIEYFDSWIEDIREPKLVQQTLEKARVLLIGAGGLGTAIANQLVNVGIGHIYIADYDTVEMSNLSRQFLYRNCDIGKSKSRVLCHRINERGLTKAVSIDEFLSAANISEVLDRIAPIDLVLGMPFPDHPEKVEELLRILSISPYLCTDEHSAGPLLLNISSHQAWTDYLEKRYSIHNLWNRQRNSRTNLDTHPSYAPTIGIAASIATDITVRYLTNYAGKNYMNSTWSIDPIGLNVKKVVLDE
jgi:hypothetical protein